MYMKMIAPLALAVLVACSGNPLENSGPGTGGGDTPVVVPPSASGVPQSLSLNLQGAAYTPGDPTITVALTSQDASALQANYTRNPTFDTNGYLAYTYQETSSNRYVVALVKEVGSAKAAVVVDAGQFANYFGGGTYARADLFTMPASGLGARYSYSGSYAGLLNIGVPAPGGPGGGLNPDRAFTTTGRALITADFTQLTMSGGVDGRQILGPGAPADPTLPDISLFSTDITSEGTFFGDVYIGTSKVGVYGGNYAGIEASEVAALLVFNPAGSSTVQEHGMIVLSNCADSGGPACP